MDNLKVQQGDYTISTDRTKLDVPMMHHFLLNSYWAQDLPLQVLEKAIKGSLCFGVYHGEKQVGFARVVTDEAMFAYLADVFILPDYRGQGLSKWLMKTILEYPTLKSLKRWMLGTADAHGLYQQFGFGPLPIPERFMQKITPFPPLTTTENVGA
jgi:GNAT superfamily N-acetyltransferase